MQAKMCLKEQDEELSTTRSHEESGTDLAIRPRQRPRGYSLTFPSMELKRQTKKTPH